MQIKRFEAKTMTAALKMVKDELGPDAVILSARTLQRDRGFFGAVRPVGVELTAAIDYEWPGFLVDSRRGTPCEATATVFTKEAPTVRRGLLQSLNDSLWTIAGRRIRPVAPQSGAVPSAELEDVHQLWASQEIAPDIALKFAEQLKRLPGYDPLIGLERLRPLAAAALHDMGLKRFLEPDESGGQRMLALVGPCGAGKTALAIKLAAADLLQRRRGVALLSLDDRRIGAAEEMRIYGEILGVPWGIAGTATEARRRVDEWASIERVIIDTPGVSPGETDRRKDLQSILRALPCREVHLVLNAGLSENDLTPVVAEWKNIPISSLAFTRIDETRRCGGILNMAVRTRLPLSWLSTGPRIPEDVTDQSLNLLLDRLWPQRPSLLARTSSVAQNVDRSAAGLTPPGSAQPLVANRNSDLYHRSDCKWARKIKRDHLLQFESAAEAKSRNFHACRSCCPDATALAGAGAFDVQKRRIFSYR